MSSPLNGSTPVWDHTEAKMANNSNLRQEPAKDSCLRFLCTLRRALMSAIEGERQRSTLQGLKLETTRWHVVEVKISISFIPVAWVAVASCSIVSAPAHTTREQLISNFNKLLEYWDKDGDRKLSRFEATEMVNESFRMIGEPQNGDNPNTFEKERRAYIAYLDHQDTDRDGYLTLSELLRDPLDTFQCLDENHDGKAREEEIFRAMNRCSS